MTVNGKQISPEVQRDSEKKSSLLTTLWLSGFIIEIHLVIVIAIFKLFDII